MTIHLDRVDTRSKLPLRRDPYWQRLTQGRHLGFRRMTRGTEGTWLARYYTGEEYEYGKLGDFAELPDKDRYDAAKAAAEAWFQHLGAGGSTNSVTVRKACEQYVAALRAGTAGRAKRRSPETWESAANDTEGRFKRLVIGNPDVKPAIKADPIAGIDLKKLLPRHIADWKARVLAAGGTLGSFNRNATALRAALNLALERREVPSDYAWASELKPFQDADGRRELYLKPAARAKLHEQASPQAQRFIRTLMLQPLRPGDVAKLRVSHFDADGKQLVVPLGKTKSRIIPLAADAVAHFTACAKDKLPAAWLIARDDGQQFTKELWRDEIKEAAAKAKLPAATCAYTLRHCVITDLVKGGLDLFHVAKLAGTSVAMIEKNYGQLQQDHARRALDSLAKG